MTKFNTVLPKQADALEAAVVAYANASKAAKVPTSSSNFFTAANGGKFARRQNVTHLPHISMGADPATHYDAPRTPRAA